MVRMRSGRWSSREEITYPNCFWLQLGACSALFLLIFALKQVQAQPVQAALSAVRSVATTEMEWDDTIGRLEFVGNFVPESVMVFWNAQERTLLSPFEDGVLLDVQENTAVFEGHGSVLCGGEGRVEEILRMQDGYAVTIKHDNGLTMCMDGLQSVYVDAQERVHKGQSIGAAVQTAEAGRLCVQVTEGRRAVEVGQWLR